MKRPLSNTLSRLTLRFPGSNPSLGCATLHTKLRLEELEGRDLPAPVVTNPYSFATPATMLENRLSAPQSLHLSACQSFSITESACVSASPYTALLQSTNGIVSVNGLSAATVYNLTVSGNQTSTLSLIGDFANVSSFFFYSGFDYTPTLGYGGTASVNLLVLDGNSAGSSSNMPIFVSPVADTPNLTAIDVTGRFPNGNPGQGGPSIFLPITYSTGTGDPSESIAYVDLGVPTDTFGNNFRYFPGPNVNDLGNSTIRIFDVAIDSFRFFGVLPLTPSVFEYSISATAQDSALNFQGNLITNYATSSTNFFYVTYNPTVRLDNLPVNVAMSPTGSNSFVVIPELLDPTSGTPDGYQLVLNSDPSSGIYSAFNPLTEGDSYALTVVGAGLGTLFISGDLTEIQRYVNDSRVSFAPAAGFEGNLTLSALLQAPPDDGFSEGGSTRNGLDSFTVYVTPLPVVIEPTAPVSGYFDIDELNGRNSAFAYTGNFSFGFSSTGAASDPYTVDLVIASGNGDIGINPGNAILTYSLGFTQISASHLQLTGTLANLNSFFQNDYWAYIPPLFWSGVETVTATLTDSYGNSDSGNRVIYVHPQATAPQVENTNISVRTPGGTAVSLNFGNIALTEDFDGSESLGYAEIYLDPSLYTTTNSNGFAFNHGVYDSETMALRVSIADLSDLTITPYGFIPGFPTTYLSFGIFTVDTAIDPFGGPGSNANGTYGTLAITVDPSMSLNMPSTVSADLSGVANISLGISIDSPTGLNVSNYTLTLTSADGTFFAPTPFGYFPGLSISGDGTSTLTLTSLDSVLIDYLNSGEAPRLITNPYTPQTQGSASVSASLMTDDGRLASANGMTNVLLPLKIWLSPPPPVAESQTGSDGFFVNPYISDDISGCGTYSLTLNGLNGTFTADQFSAACFGVSITGDGTGTLTLVGSLSSLQNYIDNRIQFLPTQYFSGFVTIDAQLVAPSETYSESFQPRVTGASVDVSVTPFVSDVFFNFYSSTTRVPNDRPMFLNSGYLSYWDDTDGSERASFRYTLSGVPADDSFQLLVTSGPPLSHTPLTNVWTSTTFTDWYEMLSSVYSVQLSAPPGYLGCVTVQVEATLADAALLTRTDSLPTVATRKFSGSQTIEFTLPPGVTTPTLIGTEGTTLDLGNGAYVASDPTAGGGCQSYSSYIVSFSVPGGTLDLDDQLISELSDLGHYMNFFTSRDGRSVSIFGSLDSINFFLSQAGSLTFSPPGSQWAGPVPLSITFEENFGEGTDLLSLGTSTLFLTPVPDAVPPSVVPAVTNQDSPVVLNISLTLPTEPDPSETFEIFIRNVPSGASLNHGTNLGGGSWQMTIEDLVGLTFTPPVGVSGTFNLTVEVVVTDVGDEFEPEEEVPSFAALSTFSSFSSFSPSSSGEASSLQADEVGGATTSTSSSTLTVTVIGNPVSPPPPVLPPPPPPPPLLPPPPPAPIDFGTTTTTSVTTTIDPTPTNTTTTTTTESTVTIAETTQAAFGLIPSGIEQKLDLSADTPDKPGSLPPLGSPAAAATTAATSFAAGREKHPLQPIQALEHESATTLFEGSGDSIPLVDQLYRDAAPATPPETPPQPPEPKSTGEPSTMAVPSEAPAPPAAAASAVIAEAEVDAERIAGETRNDSSEAAKSSSVMTSLALGLLPLLSTLFFTESRPAKPRVSRVLRHLLFKPRTREGRS